MLLLAAASVSAAAYVELDAAPSRDCQQARDPRRCTARLAARSACRDKAGLEKRRCQQALLAPPDCDRAAQPERCAALAEARNACKTKSGAAYRRCMRARVPAWRSYQAG